MLKGIRKSKNHEEPISNQIPTTKKQIVSNEISQQVEQLQVLKRQTLSIFLSGRVDQLRENLQKVMRAQAFILKEANSKAPFESMSQPNTTKRGTQKFSYSYDFQQNQQEQDNSKGHKKRKTNPKVNFQHKKSNRSLQECIYCVQNQQLTLLSASNHVYLAFPKLKTFRKYWHFILSPIQHHQTSIGLEEDILEEIKNYKKCLLQMFDKDIFNVVFFQQFSQPNSHIFIECLAIPLKKSQDLPFFFKQGLQDIQGEWSTHKNIIQIQKQKGGLQKQIPKQIKYFYIDFSLNLGYAHAIQNQKFWNRNFVYEILATALGMQQYQIKTNEEYSPEQLQKRSIQFNQKWKPFDWTALINQQN